MNADLPSVELAKPVRPRSSRCAATTGSEKPFTERLEDLDRYELMRRCTNQASTIAAYQQCLDGLGLWEKLASGGLENHRRPDDIRDIVERLLSPNEKDHL